MAGKIVHFEIPADDTAKGQEFWGSLFGWKFESYPGPSEYHMTRISDELGGAITNMEPGKRGLRVYFDVDDINAGAATREGARRRGRRADARAEHGLVLDLQGPAGERVRPLAERPVRPDPGRLRPRRRAASLAGAARRPVPGLRRRGALELVDLDLLHLQHRLHDALRLLRHPGRRAARAGASGRSATTARTGPSASRRGPPPRPRRAPTRTRSTSSCVSQLTWNETASVKRELRAAVQGDELLAVQLEAHGHRRPLRARARRCRSG